MTQRCDRILSLIPSAADGDLDEASRAKVVEHTLSCPDCAEAWDFHSRLRYEIEAAPASSPPALYFEGVLAEIHRAMPVVAPHSTKVRSVWRRRPRRETWATAMTAALMLMWVGMGAVARLDHRPIKKETAVIREARNLASAKGSDDALVWVEGMGLRSTQAVEQMRLMAADLGYELTLGVIGDRTKASLIFAEG